MKAFAHKLWKSITAGIICAAFMLETVPTMHPYAINDQIGDVNGDGVIGVEDAVEILTSYARQSANLNTDLSAEQMLCADINGDGMLSVEDAVCVLTYYAKASAGLDPSWDEEGHGTTVTTTTILTEVTTTEAETTTVVTTLQTHSNGAVIPPNTGDLFVILNTNTMCYHLSSTCRAAKRINAENYAEVSVAGVWDVEQYGYTACGICAK